MVRLAVVHRVSFLPLDRGGAKQLYGVRPARPSPGERTAAMSQLRPETSPCRTPSRQSDGIDPCGDGCWPRSIRESRPGKVGVRSASRIVPVSAWLGVRAASCGRWFNGFALLDTLLIRCVGRSPGPRRGGQSKSNGVGHSTHRAKGIDRDRVPLLRGLFERSPWRAPVRPTAPRAGPVVASVNQHGSFRLLFGCGRLVA